MYKKIGTSWVESPLFVFCASTAIAIVLTVLAAVLKDLRWLLIIVWPLASVAVWELGRTYGTRRPIVWATIGAIISGLLLALLYWCLSPNPSETARSTIDLLLDATTNPWFHWLGGSIIGFAIGVWLDAAFRRSGEVSLLPQQDFQKSIPIVNMFLDESNVPDAVPWLQFGCTIFNGSTAPIHFVSARGKLNIAGQEFRHEIELSQAINQFCQYGSFLSIPLKIQLTQAEKLLILGLNPDDYIQVEFIAAQMTGSAYFIGDCSREFGLNIPVSVEFYGRTGTPVHNIYDLSNLPSARSGTRSPQGTARRTRP